MSTSLSFSPFLLLICDISSTANGHLPNCLPSDVIFFGKQIVPAKCRYDVMSTKIEIRLVKADTIHWSSLEYSRDVAVVQKAVVSSGTCLSGNVNFHTHAFSCYISIEPLYSASCQIGNQKPTYPSSKPKRVDWDKLEAEVKKEVSNFVLLLSSFPVLDTSDSWTFK